MHLGAKGEPAAWQLQVAAAAVLRRSLFVVRPAGDGKTLAPLMAAAHLGAPHAMGPSSTSLLWGSGGRRRDAATAVVVAGQLRWWLG